MVTVVYQEFDPTMYVGVVMFRVWDTWGIPPDLPKWLYYVILIWNSLTMPEDSPRFSELQ